MGTELGDALQEYMSARWEPMRGVRLMVGIPDDPTDEDIRRILLFLERGHYPAMLAVKMIWVDRYWDEDKSVLSPV
jgi:hypothetical protein